VAVELQWVGLVCQLEVSVLPSVAPALLRVALASALEAVSQLKASEHQTGRDGEPQQGQRQVEVRRL
jgi:hypothetical protein